MQNTDSVGDAFPSISHDRVYCLPTLLVHCISEESPFQMIYAWAILVICSAVVNKHASHSVRVKDF